MFNPCLLTKVGFVIALIAWLSVKLRQLFPIFKFTVKKIMNNGNDNI